MFGCKRMNVWDGLSAQGPESESCLLNRTRCRSRSELFGPIFWYLHQAALLRLPRVAGHIRPQLQWGQITWGSKVRVSGGKMTTSFSGSWSPIPEWVEERWLHPSPVPGHPRLSDLEGGTQAVEAESQSTCGHWDNVKHFNPVTVIVHLRQQVRCFPACS